MPRQSFVNFASNLLILVIENYVGIVNRVTTLLKPACKDKTAIFFIQIQLHFKFNLNNFSVSVSDKIHA